MLCILGVILGEGIGDCGGGDGRGGSVIGAAMN